MLAYPQAVLSRNLILSELLILIAEPNVIKSSPIISTM